MASSRTGSSQKVRRGFSASRRSCRCRRDADRVVALRRSLALYRMVFGQLRQDDLLKSCARFLTIAGTISRRP